MQKQPPKSSHNHSSIDMPLGAMPLRWWSPSSYSTNSHQQQHDQHRQRRLTRAKQIRHLSDQDLKDLDFSSLNSPARGRDNNNNDFPYPYLCPCPQAQPLPLPALSALFSSADNKQKTFPLPSPTQAPAQSNNSKRGRSERARLRIKEKETQKLMDQRAGTRNIGSRVTPLDGRPTVDAQRGTDDARPIVDFRKGAHLQRSIHRAETWPSRNANRSHENFSIHISFRSSPTSTANSSPQRILNGSEPISLYPVEPKPWSPISTEINNVPINVHPLPLPPTRPQFLPTKSQWTKGKLIGRGTFGSVYVATNRETGALCAMKEVEIFPDDPKSAECIRQLEQEIKVLSHLKHPNIVQYYGSEIVDDKFYIYLEYVYPGSINKYVRDHHGGAITEALVRNFTRHILSGLAYLHGRKIVHRDIKGANLLVDASGVVKLADFGMAKHLTGQGADLSLKGSPYWIAPELIQDVMKKDSSSEFALSVDIWSLGCTVIEMLTGKPPWSGYEGAAAMFKVLKESPPIPETLSFEGKDFLRCCFRRNPADRPSACKLLDHPFLRNSQQSDIISPTSHRIF